MIKRVCLIASFVTLLALLVACRGIFNAPSTEEPEGASTPTSGATASVSTASGATPTPVPAVKTATATATEPADNATATPTPTTTPTPWPTATLTSTPLPSDLSISAEDVYLYPVPSIYDGDKVTIQMLPYVPERVHSDEVTVDIVVDGEEIAEGALGGRNYLSGEVTGLFEWVWDTTGLVGPHRLEVILDREDVILAGDENPDNNQVALTVTVNDRGQLPAVEANAIWKMAESECCNVHVVSGTAADRDLPLLLTAVDAAVQQASQNIGEEPRNRLDVYFIDRVIGQGGYAGSAMVVSYLDRDYASSNLHQVLVHEAVHLLDRQFAPQRIPFLAEGLAVWASAGHYKAEDVDLTAAALLQTRRFVPLVELINDFYPVQHEIGYMEAAGLVSYLVETYGWPRFRDFYADVVQTEQLTLAEVFDAKLMQHYAIGLDELERRWRTHLESLLVNGRLFLDIETTVRYYDMMRSYQQRYDPTAYFLIAWLPSPGSVQEKGNPADLTRHPETELNVTLEVMLQAAGEAMRAGDYSRANTLLGSVERVLNTDGHFIDPFAINYWNIVQTATELGYEVQHVALNGATADVLVAESDTQMLLELNLVLKGQEWILSN